MAVALDFGIWHEALEKDSKEHLRSIPPEIFFTLTCLSRCLRLRFNVSVVYIRIPD